MGNYKSKMEVARPIINAQLAYDVETPKADINNQSEKIAGKTIVYINQRLTCWSVGYVVKIEKNKVFILDKFTSTLSKFDIESLALNWNNLPIDRHNPRIENYKTVNDLCIFGDPEKKYNNGAMYVDSGSYIDNKTLNKKSSEFDVFSNISYKLYNKKSINVKELYLSNKVRVSLRNRFGDSYRNVYMNGIIHSITNDYITLLVKNNSCYNLIEIDRKYMDRIYKYEPEDIKLFTTVKHKSHVAVVADIIGDKVKLSGSDELFNMADCEQVDVTYDECMPYFNKEKEAVLINFYKKS